MGTRDSALGAALRAGDWVDAGASWDMPTAGVVFRIRVVAVYADYWSDSPNWCRTPNTPTRREVDAPFCRAREQHQNAVNAVCGAVRSGLLQGG